MTHRTTAALLAGVLIAFVVPASGAEGPQEPRGNSADQLQSLQDERIRVLTQLVQLATTQYEMGLGDFTEVFSAQHELVAAQLDSTDDPQKRIALLTQDLESVTSVLNLTEKMWEAGVRRQSDVLRARSLMLTVKIQLLRERDRLKPPAPPAR